MSLEDALRENTAAMTEHNDLLRQVIGLAAKKPAAKAAASDDEGGDAAETKKPATTRRRAAKDEDGGEADTKKSTAKTKGPTVEDVSTVVTDWLGELQPELDDDGEPVDDDNAKLLKRRNARKTFVKKCLAKVGAGKVSEITEAGDLKKVHDWIEAKKGGTDPFADEEDE